MSNRNPEDDYSSLVTALRFFFGQLVKDIHTAFVAHVVTYDPSTKRAEVQPAIRSLMTDGTEMLRAPVANVPVVWPGGGGIALTFPLKPKDPVLIICSERGLTGFKLSFGEASPDRESILDAKDAVAVAGFGAISIIKAGLGAALQTEDALTYVEVHADGISIVKENQYVSLTDDGMTADIDGKIIVASSDQVSIEAPKVSVVGDLEVTGAIRAGASLDVDGGAFRHMGRDVGALHLHAGVQPGGGISGPPK